MVLQTPAEAAAWVQKHAGALVAGFAVAGGNNLVNNLTWG
jgi:hypothetical protein